MFTFKHSIFSTLPQVWHFNDLLCFGFYWQCILKEYFMYSFNIWTTQLRVLLLFYVVYNVF